MRIDIKVPTKWNELTPFQLKMIGRLLYSKTEFEQKFFKQLLVVVVFIPKVRFIHFWKFFLLLREVSFNDLLSYTDFIFDENDNLTQFPESFKVRRSWFKTIRLYGPGIRLQNITINELSYADAFYFNWIQKGSDDDLQNNVAA